MATYEQDIAMYETKENGDKVIKLPVTRVNNVEGIGRSASTAYAVGDVVYVDNNKKVALKCTTAGTTSSSELDVSSKAIGSSVTDGSVVWQVCNRTSDVTSVNGKTGDVVVEQIEDYVQSAYLEGSTIVLTKADGTTIPLILEIPSGGSTVSVTGGTLSNGGTIPLPSGYTREQCKYAVWAHEYANASERNNGYGMYGLKVQVNQDTGVVTASSRNYSADDGMKWNGSSLTVGYICIAVK